MLSILYPVQDFTAADVAIRVQALAVGKGQKIYAVPKHFGRNREQVFRNLDKSSVGLFISYDRDILDHETQDELDFLAKNRKRMLCMVPDSLAGTLASMYPNAEVFDFSRTGKRDFAETIDRVVHRLQPKPAQKASKQNDFVAGAAILAITLLLFGLLADGKK